MGELTLGFKPGEEKDKLVDMIKESAYSDKLAMIYIETPANPTNALIDIRDCKNVADVFQTADKPVYLAVDNTYMGPLWQHPLKHGADFVLYSATKYIGGHSDVIAGAVLGNREVMSRVKTLRTFLGNMCGPWTGWLLLRSLETLKVRMDQQATNAMEVAKFLQSHPKVERVYFLGLISEDDLEYQVFKNQCLSPGAMLSFDVRGGEEEAFSFLNHLKLIKLAVSLGSTESLAEHPATMTHAGVNPEHREAMNITSKMVRLSIGVENVKDIIWDINQALSF